MTPVSDATLTQMVEAIVAEVSPEQVILFGSQARGDQEQQSDVDLARALREGTVLYERP